MKKGDRVMIYIDPLTERCPEAEAILIRKLHTMNDMEYWRVKFVNEEGKYNRYNRLIKKGGLNDLS